MVCAEVIFVLGRASCASCSQGCGAAFAPEEKAQLSAAKNTRANWLMACPFRRWHILVCHILTERQGRVELVADRDTINARPSLRDSRRFVLRREASRA